VLKDLQGSRPLVWVVHEDLRDQVHGVGRRPRTEHLVPWVRFYLRKLKLRVVRVHTVDLLTGRCAKDFDDFDKLVNARLAREKRLSEQ
jgi:hypothetical protein